MINPYGQAITGYNLQELKGRAFVTLLLSGESADKASMHLAELVAGSLAHLEEECELRCKDQSALKVVWQHSRLKGEGDDAALILSVGMDITARKSRTAAGVAGGSRSAHRALQPASVYPGAE